MKTRLHHCANFISHTCHIDIKNSDVEVDRRGIIMLCWPSELIIFHEQILLQPIGPGLIPYRGPYNKSSRDNVGSYNYVNHVRYGDCILPTFLAKYVSQDEIILFNCPTISRQYSTIYRIYFMYFYSSIITYYLSLHTDFICLL